MSHDRVRTIIAEAEEMKAEPPRPLMRELPPADPFPIDALGPVLEPAAVAIHDRVQAPLAICAQSVLAAATLAVQGHADVELPIGGSRAKPVSCYFVTVAASGERKTEADYQAGRAISKHEKALREEYDFLLPSYLNDKAGWDKAREVAIKEGRGERAAIKSALDQIGPEPQAPLQPMLTCPEPTFEGLYKLLALGFPSLGVFSNEGGQFIGGHGMNAENKLKTASGLSSLWDGVPPRRVRSGDGASTLPGRRVAMHLMVQPEVADILLQDRQLAEQGFLSRVLATAPESAAGKRMPRPERPETERTIKKFDARLLDILEMPLPLANGKTNELEPRSLPLSWEAKDLWFAFVAHVEQAIGPGGAMEAIKGLANKLPEHAARLAAVLTLVDDLHAIEVPANYMRTGIALAEHYSAEALRLFGKSQANADLQLAQRLLDWLNQDWSEPVISLPDIYQLGPNPIRDQATARRLVTLLEGHGHLAKLPGGAVVAGHQRREAWRAIRGQ